MIREISILACFAAAVSLPGAVVTSLQNSGAGTLRAAIAGAVAGEIITFSPALGSSALTVSDPPIQLDRDVTIDGAGQGVIVRGFTTNYDSSVLRISAGANVRLMNLTVGTESSSIVFGNAGSLTVTNCQFSNSNENPGYGSRSAAIQNETNATLSIVNSTFDHNAAGVQDFGGVVMVTNSLFTRTFEKAALSSMGGTVSVASSTFLQNRGRNSIQTTDGAKLLVKNSTFHQNETSSGDIQSYNSEVLIADSEFTENYGMSSSPYGTIFNYEGSLQVTNSEFRGNRLGAIQNYGSTVIINSQFTSNSVNVGAAIRNSGNLAVTNVIFQKNVAINGGGALANYTGSAILQDCKLAYNSGMEGGAIYNYATLFLNNTIVSTNDGGGAPSGSYIRGNGGGLFNDSGSATLNHCTIAGNTALVGAGIYLRNGEVSINGSTLSGNFANSGYSLFPCEGGAIFSTGGRLRVNESTISRNSVGTFLRAQTWPGFPPGPITYLEVNGVGGGLLAVGGEVEINGSTFSHNSAGGIHARPATSGQTTLRAFNTTIASNTFAENYGAGVYAGTPIQLINCTIVGNTGPKGAGIYSMGGLTLSNTIVALNIASFDAQISGPYEGASNFIERDPQLMPLGNYGGLTETMPPQIDSPVIDAGVANTLVTDQRGFQRVVGLGIDVGAVEANSALQPKINSPSFSINAGAQFSFVSSPERPFRIWATTDLSVPFSTNSWIAVGYATETPAGSGIYTFSDSTASGLRFYVARSE